MDDFVESMIVCFNPFAFQLSSESTWRRVFFENLREREICGKVLNRRTEVSFYSRLNEKFYEKIIKSYCILVFDRFQDQILLLENFKNCITEILEIRGKLCQKTR